MRIDFCVVADQFLVTGFVRICGVGIPSIEEIAISGWDGQFPKRGVAVDIEGFVISVIIVAGDEHTLRLFDLNVVDQDGGIGACVVLILCLVVGLKQQDRVNGLAVNRRLAVYSTLTFTHSSVFSSMTPLAAVKVVSR